MIENIDGLKKWSELFASLAILAKVKDPDFTHVAQLNRTLGSVGLVQPFNWNAWRAPFIEFHEMWDLPLIDCVKHVTRVVRMDRTSEGVLWGALRSGALTILCTVAFSQIEGSHSTSGSVPSLEILEGGAI